MVIGASQEIWFENPKVGQRSRIVTLPGETGGRQFVIEYINRPFGGRNAVPPHVHTAYMETFEILRGCARYRLGSETKTAVAGERVTMPPLVPHVHPWSDSAEELHVRQIADANPSDLRGLNSGLQAAITLQGLARAGRVNTKGLPNLLQLGVLIADHPRPATGQHGASVALRLCRRALPSNQRRRLVAFPCRPTSGRWSASRLSRNSSTSLPLATREHLH